MINLMQLCLNLLYHVLLSLYVMCVIYHWVKRYFLHNLKLLMFHYLFTNLMTRCFFNNYRPVSISCALSQVFEKVMYNRLLHFINELDILYKFQFGFRKDCSTHIVLITLMDKLITALENGEFTIGVFLDFPNAFDTINHQILFDKWYHYGIRGVAITWCKFICQIDINL